MFLVSGGQMHHLISFRSQQNWRC